MLNFLVQDGRVLLKCTAMLGNYFIKSEEVSLQHAHAHTAHHAPRGDDDDDDGGGGAEARRRPYTGLFEDADNNSDVRTQSGAVKYEDTVRYYSDILISATSARRSGHFRCYFLLCLHVLLAGFRWA